jgi:predicted GNAT family N-acyltransferase
MTFARPCFIKDGKPPAKGTFLRVLRISPIDTHSIRQQMLRADFTLEDCVFQGDDEEQTFHLGAFVDNKLVSVASFYYERHHLLPDEHQYRLRGMATLSDFQHRGLSSELLKMAFPIIKQNFCTLLWCNARQSAVGFYQKVGFVAVGDEFEIPGIGIHQMMSRKID